MAYTDTGHTHKQIAAATGVALVHIALAFGLAAGLTIKYTMPPEDPGLEGTNVIVDLPPPTPVETEEPTETVAARQVDSYTPPIAPPVDIDLTHTPTIALVDLPPIRPLDRIDTGRIERTVTIEPPPPTFTPKAPAPTNGPVGWVSTNDYPRRALTRGWEGDLTYALDVAANGRVQQCRILSSTGHDILDAKACEVIERRARFDPATDASGNAVFGTFRGRVSWIIPED